MKDEFETVNRRKQHPENWGKSFEVKLFRKIFMV